MTYSRWFVDVDTSAIAIHGACLKTVVKGCVFNLLQHANLRKYESDSSQRICNQVAQVAVVGRYAYSYLFADALMPFGLDCIPKQSQPKE